MRRLRLVLALTIFAAATPVLALWQVLALLSGGLIDQRRAPRLWHRLVLRLLGVRVHVHGQPARERPLLIAANHISWTDIMVLGATLDVYFIAKKEVASWPVFGWLAKLQRTVFIDRARPNRVGDQAGEIAARLADGEPMVLFAEGTTGDGNDILPFKSALFAAAQMQFQTSAGDQENTGAHKRTGGFAATTTGATGGRTGSAPGGAAVQPVAIIYTRRHGMPVGRRGRMKLSWIGDQTLLPHLRELLGHGGVDVELHFADPIAFGPDVDRKQVAREAEHRVRQLLKHFR